jgi:hypothetical protein
MNRTIGHTNNNESAAAHSRVELIHHTHGKAYSHGSVHSIPTIPEDFHADFRGDGMGGNNGANIFMPKILECRNA